MKLHHLKPAEGSKKRKIRVGRGEAGRRGKTAGRGTKGQKARGTVRPGFEGGQMPLQRRMPKLKGFKNPNKEVFAVLNSAKPRAASSSSEQWNGTETASFIARRRPASSNACSIAAVSPDRTYWRPQAADQLRRLRRSTAGGRLAGAS